MNPVESAQIFRKRDALFFAGVFAFAYLHLFRLPATPIYFDGDTFVPVSNAIRIIGGEAIYKDFFHFIAPGADLLYAALFFAFGQSVWVINAVILALTLGQIAVLWFFSKRTLDGWAIYVPSLIYLAFGFRQFGIDGSYRLMGVVMALGAVAFLAARRSPANLMIAGTLCAVASFFQQPRGVLVAAAIGLFLAWEWYIDGSKPGRLLRDWAFVGGSFLALTLLLHGYFLWTIGVQDYYYAMFEFIGSSYRADSFNNNSAYLSDLRAYLSAATGGGGFASTNARLLLISAFYYFLVPYAYVAFLIYAWVRRSDLKDKPVFRVLVLLCVTGVMLALGVSAPTITRVYHVAIPAVLLTVWLGSRFYVVRFAMPVVAAFLVLICVGLSVQRQASPHFDLDMPAGRAAFLFEPTYAKYEWIGENTRPGDVIYEPSHPNYYFPFHLTNPTPLFNARDSEYTPAAQVGWVVRSLESRPPSLIIWPVSWSKDPGERVAGDNLAPLWDFVKNRYVPVHTFERIDDPAQAIYSDNVVYRLRTELKQQ